MRQIGLDHLMIIRVPERLQHVRISHHGLWSHAIELAHAVAHKAVLARAVIEECQAEHDAWHLGRDQPEVLFAGAHGGLRLLACSDVLDH